MEDFSVIIVSMSVTMILVSSIFRLIRKYLEKSRTPQIYLPLIEKQYFTQRRYYRVSEEKPQWYIDFVENEDARRSGKLNFPRDQIYQYLDINTIKKENFATWIPEWYKDFLLDMNEPFYSWSNNTNVPWRPVYQFCFNCEFSHCKHNPKPIKNDLQCNRCTTINCIHYDRGGFEPDHEDEPYMLPMGYENDEDEGHIEL
jgi:hypothetical protein